MKEITITDAIDKYLNEKYIIGTFSDSTVYNRRYELNRLNLFCKRNNINKVNNISKSTVISYLESLRIIKSTKRTILSILTSFFDFLNTEEYVEDNVAFSIKPPRTNIKPPDHLTTEEIKKLFEVEQQNAPPLVVDRNLLIYSLLFYLCLRVNELTNLKKSDVRLNGERREIWITRKGGDVMALSLPDFIVKRFENWYAARENYKGSNSDWVFLSKRGNKIAVRSVRAVVERGIKNAGLVKKKNGSHVLRHSGASMYSKNGEDPRKIQFMMGHKKLITTTRYLHFDNEELSNMIESCPEII